jgi:ABC-type multidrug transport system fused ATPase/permease subunit
VGIIATVAKPATAGAVSPHRLIWVTRLLRPYWGRLAIALAAMLVESGADLLEPWPLKIIFDYVIDAKHPPHWLQAALPHGYDRMMLLTVAALSVAGGGGRGGSAPSR